MSNPKIVLIIDDEDKLRALLSRIIQSEGLEVFEATDCKSGLRKLTQRDVDVVLCDVKLPDGNGVDLIQKIKSSNPLIEIILLTAYGNIQDGIQAIKYGAFDYLVKGDDNERMIPLLHRAIEKAQFQKRIHVLEKRVSEKFSFDAIIGKSKPIQQAIDLAKKVAPNKTTVLLVGETGTGKEIFAQAIHQYSDHSSGSFVALNCSAFSRDILESELFGHVQGAFTGAIKDKKGFLEEANGGSLFLDEIGEMPLELQAKFLRALETNEFIKLGDTKPYKSNFRLIAATNKDLKKESAEGHFRSDLYFRLNVFQIQIQPLRQRVKDIEPLANYFLKQSSAKMNKSNLAISAEYLEKLEAYHWPGNVRELKNMIERSVILTDGHELMEDSLTPELTYPSSLSKNLPPTFNLAGVEKLHIQKVMHYTKGNKTETAKLLGVGIATLYRKLEEYKG